MKIVKYPVWLLLALVLASGCRSIPPPTAQDAAASSQHNPSSTNFTNSAKKPSEVYVHMPRPRQPFSTWQKMNPVWWFGNAEEPEAPGWYRPGQCCRDFLWHLRNP